MRKEFKAVLFSLKDSGEITGNLFKVTYISDDAAPDEPRGTCCTVIRLAPFTKSLSRLLAP